MTAAEWKKKKQEEEEKAKLTEYEKSLAGITDKPLGSMTAAEWRTIKEARADGVGFTPEAFTADADEIAPVAGGKKDSWVKSGGFSDGVDGVGDFFGDLAETTVGTAGDIILGLQKGIMRPVEGLTDLVSYGAAGLYDLFGNDEFADTVRQRTQRSWVDDIGTTKIPGGQIDMHSMVDKYSVLGDKSDAVVEGLGQVGAIIATGGVGSAAGLGGAGVSALTTATTGLSSMGTNIGEAYNAGATDGQAFVYGLSTGAIEAGTELLFGGLGKGVKALGLSRGLGGVDDMLAKGLSDKITKLIAKDSVKKVVGNTIEALVKATGEGVEEVAAGLGSALMKKLTYASEEEWEKLVADENLLESFIVGAVTSSIAQGSDYVKANASKTDFVTGMTSAEEKVINKAAEQEIAQKEANGEKLTKKDKNEIYDRLSEDISRGYISIDTIEETLGGDKYTEYKKASDENAALKKELDELRNMKSGDMTDIQKDRLTELKAMNLDDTSKIDELKKQMSDDVLNLVKSERKGQGSLLMESYNEKERLKQDYVANYDSIKGKKYEAAARQTIDNAVKAGANNSNRVHDLVDMAAKLSSETGIVYKFGGNEAVKADFIQLQNDRLAKLEAIENPNEAQIKEIDSIKELIRKVESGETQVNGNFTGKGIMLNLDSPKLLNTVVGHEVTHTLEQTKHYEALQKALFTYAKSKGVDIDAQIAEYAEIYKGVEGADAKGELTADLIGDYLFNDYDFVKTLAKDRNVFQRMWDRVKYLGKLATAGSKEARELARVERMFAKAYQESKAEVNKEAYSFAGRNAKTAESANDWFKGYDGKERFEIDDSNIEIISNPTRTVSNSYGKTTTLEQIIKHDELFAAYPELRDLKVVSGAIQGKGIAGAYDSSEDVLKINQYIMLSEDMLKDLLVHEIQHKIQRIEGFARGSSPAYWEQRGISEDEYTSFVSSLEQRKAHILSNLTAEERADYERYSETSQQIDKLLSQIDVESIMDGTASNVDDILAQTASVEKENDALYDKLYKNEWFKDIRDIDNTIEEGISEKLYTVFYKNTAGEIEARDVTKRRTLTAEERKNIRPDIDRTDVVFADKGKTDLAYIGNTKDGRRVYESSFGKEVSQDERINAFKEKIKLIFNLGAVELKTDVKKIVVKGDKFTRKKNLFGDHKWQSGEMEAKVNSLYDLVDILSTATYDPSATTKEDSYANPSQKPKNPAHKGVKYWYKFRNEIVFDGVPYTVTFNIRDKGGEQYQYLIDFKENKTPGLNNAAVNSFLPADQVSYDNSIPQNSEKSSGLENISDSDLAPTTIEQYSLSSADTKQADANYAFAVEHGDTETAQRMVDEAAKAAGYNSPMLYHGTGAFGFTQIDTKKSNDRISFFATDSMQVAGTYSGTSVARNIGDATKSNLGIYQLYANTDGMIEFDAKGAESNHIELGRAEKDYNDIIHGKSWYSFATAKQLAKYAKQKGYTGVIIKNVVDSATPQSRKTTYPANVYIFFDSAQVKSADPVTYDDNGNVIPLSERFKNDNNDIRYSLSTENVTNPIGHRGVLGSQFRVQEDIAPLTTNNVEAPTSLNSVDNTVGGVDTNVDTDNKQTVSERIAAQIENFRTELDNNVKNRAAAAEDFDIDIAMAEAEYKKLKNKTTRKANDILRRIERLERLKSNVDADYQNRIDNLQKRIDKLGTVEYKRAEQRRSKQQTYTEETSELIGDTSTWRDKKLGISYQVNTLRRNLRDTVRDANGKKDIAAADAIYDYLQGTYNHNEAQLKQESRKIKQPFADMKINKHESAYAQMLGELRHNPDTTLTKDKVDKYFRDHKNKIDTKKVEKIISEARKVYDDLIKRVNEVLREQGMREIAYREGYFPHFTEDKQSWIGKLLNWKTKNDDIPTDIAGLTETFEPVRSYQSFDKKRTTDKTDYNFKKGFDTYVHGALDWIYHIEDIQKRRAFENEIRYRHSEQGVQNKIDEIKANTEYDADEAQKQIDSVFEEARNPLNNFVTDFRRATQTLAGKKSSADRELEYSTNRKIYSTMTNISNRVSANMVAGSVSSALTNIIPITQSWSQVSPIRTIQAMRDTIRNYVRDDGTIMESDFLTNRLLQEENLDKTAWDHISDKVGFLMETVDGFTSQVVWRSKYLDNIKNGMSESQAIANADAFAEGIMAGRSRGNMPTVFDSKNPITKMLTAFQLEVANQYGYMFKDMPNEMWANHKGKLIGGYVGMYAGAFVYNALYSALTGRDAAFDPIGIFIDLCKDLGFGDDDEEEVDVFGAVSNLTENVVQEIPFVGGLLGGGRVPISSALPYDMDFGEAWSDIEGILTEEDKERYTQSLINELTKPLWYVALPMGGGQLRKTVQGLSMFSDDHPVAGSYTDSGNLRFPVEDTIGNRIQAGIFGQYASDNARYYFDNDLAPLGDNQIQEYDALDMSFEDYWSYRNEMSDISKRGDEEGATNDDIIKSKYINSVSSQLSSIQSEKKKVMEDTKFTERMKQAKISELDKQFNDLAKERYDSYNKVSYDGNYANIGDQYYQWYTPENGESHWRKLDEDQVTKYKVTSAAGNVSYATDGNVHYKLDKGGDWRNISDWTKISDSDLKRQNEVTKELGITPEEYWSETDTSYMPMRNGEYEYAYDYPKQYAVAKAVGGYDAYRGYSKALNDIKSDKDANGKTINGSRKEKVLQYIESLEIPYGEKIILFRSEYNADDTYNYDIVRYLESLDYLTYEEKLETLKALGMEVDQNGNIWW